MVYMNDKNENKKFINFISGEYHNLIVYVKKYMNERYYNITAEDIVQDVALNIFSKADFDSQVENIAGYFYRSLKNRISDIRRKKKNELLIDNFSNNNSENSFFETILIDEFDESKTINDSKFYKKLNEALDNLNPNQQAVIIATEIEHFTFDELSMEWGVPVGTLLSWKSRGMKKLKEKIKLDDFYIENE